MRGDYLFADLPLRDAFRTHQEAARRAVDELSESLFRARAANDLTAELEDRFRFVPLTLREDQIEVSEEEAELDIRGDPSRDVRDRSRPFYVPATRIRYHVPFEGDAELWRCRPSAFLTQMPSGSYNDTELVFEFIVEAKDLLATKARVDRELALGRHYLDNQRKEVEAFAGILRQEIESAIARRRERLEAVSAGLASFGIPIRRSLSLDRSAPPVVAAHEATKSSQPYEVALSYAGEDREYVDEVARLLREQGVAVFYDRFEEAELWGKNLVDHFSAIYGERSRFVVIFASEHYARKPWTTLERRAAQAKAMKLNEEMVLPARFDDTELPSLPSSIGFVDLRRKTPAELVELILKKLSRGES